MLRKPKVTGVARVAPGQEGVRREEAGRAVTVAAHSSPVRAASHSPTVRATPHSPPMRAMSLNPHSRASCQGQSGSGLSIYGKSGRVGLSWAWFQFHGVLVPHKSPRKVFPEVALTGPFPAGIWKLTEAWAMPWCYSPPLRDAQECLCSVQTEF